jgi:tRNA G10  N-methylase Trm11
MAHLIELGCSKEGIVLDPFVGSGTTCIAAKMLNRKFIGIELNEEYAKIASARLEDVEIVKYDSSNKIEVNREEISKSIEKAIPIGDKPQCDYEGECKFKINNICYMDKKRREKYCEMLEK